MFKIKYNFLAKVQLFSEVLFYSYSTGNNFSLIKTVNYEKMYQFGNLLQTQRRSKNTKAGKTVSYKQKVISQIGLEDVSGNISEDEYAEIEVSKTESAKTQAKKSNCNTKHPVIVKENKEIVNCERQSELQNDKFVFQSHLPINEENFPLVNLGKNHNFSPNCIVKNVLHYSFKDPCIKYCLSFPSVSKIIEDTMSDKNKQLLAKWRLNMITEMGEDKFHKHNEGLKVINSFARDSKYPRIYQAQPKCISKSKKKKSVRARGQEFHTAVLNTLLGKEVNGCSEVTKKALDSLAWMLEHVSHPAAVESVIAHPKLEYKGIPDCVALFRNIPVVIDWKLSDKPKKDLKDTYDAPVQITAYIGAMNHDPNYQWGDVTHGLVAVAYTNGNPCDVFLLAPKHCQIYWRHWLLRLEKFRARSHLHIEHDIDEKSLEL